MVNGRKATSIKTLEYISKISQSWILVEFPVQTLAILCELNKIKTPNDFTETGHASRKYRKSSCDELLYRWVFVCSRSCIHHSSPLGQNEEFYSICIIIHFINLTEKSTILKETLYTERNIFNTLQSFINFRKAIHFPLERPVLKKRLQWWIMILNPSHNNKEKC